MKWGERMFNFGMETETERLTRAVRMGAKNAITDLQFVEREILRFKGSRRLRDMLNGAKYYAGKHDILHRKRTVIGENGELTVVSNLPNNRIVDNQYKKMVDQKANYLLGQPISIQTDNEAYEKVLTPFFNKAFMRLMKNMGKNSLNEGIGWLYVGYDDSCNLTFKRFRGEEIIPGWKDVDHTALEYAIRLYEVVFVEDQRDTILEKVEVYEETGIYYFDLVNSHLIPCEPYHQPYFTMIDAEGKAQGYAWTRIPLIPFKRDAEETPLIRCVKSLQDGLNSILSNFQNNMEEDTRNTILVLVNYDGENLGQFRRNLATYGAVKVRNDSSSAGGDLKTLQIEVNADNYKAILELFKKAIIENAMGYDAKDDRLGGNPNQMNIQSMYSDIDLDANDMETEYQAGFEELLWFINCHLANMGLGDFEGEEVTVIFNRDMLISESEVIDNISKSVGVLSDETLVANHPWVDDPHAELERKKAEQAEQLEAVYSGALPTDPIGKVKRDGEPGS